jgi:hypothetical protein
VIDAIKCEESGGTVCQRKIDNVLAEISFDLDFEERQNPHNRNATISATGT